MLVIKSLSLRELTGSFLFLCTTSFCLIPLSLALGILCSWMSSVAGSLPLKQQLWKACLNRRIGATLELWQWGMSGVPGDRMGERGEVQSFVALLVSFYNTDAPQWVFLLNILKTSSSSASHSPEQTIQIRKPNRFKDVTVRKVWSAPSSDAGLGDMWYISCLVALPSCPVKFRFILWYEDMVLIQHIPQHMVRIKWKDESIVFWILFSTRPAPAFWDLRKVCFFCVHTLLLTHSFLWLWNWWVICVFQLPHLSSLVHWLPSFFPQGFAARSLPWAL